MADLKIKVIGFLDETLSKTQLQNQLDKIAKGLKLSVGIDSKQLTEFNDAVKKMQTQLNGQKSAKIVNDADVKASKDIFTSVEKAVEYYQKLGTIKVNKIFDTATGDLKAFNLEIQRTDGLIDKLRFKSSESLGMNGVGGFALTGQTQVDKTSMEMQKALSQTLQQRIADERKLAEAQAQQVGKNEQITMQLKEQLDLYKRQAEIRVNSLLNNPNKILTTGQQDGLQTYLNSVRALNTESPRVQQQMRQLALDYREISSQAQTAGRNNLTFGESFATAMQKFPIKVYRWE